MNIFQKLMTATIATLIFFYFIDRMDDHIQEKLEKGKELNILEKFLLNYVNKLINLIVRAYPLVFIVIIVVLYVEFTPSIKKYISGIESTGEPSVDAIKETMVGGGTSASSLSSDSVKEVLKLDAMTTASVASSTVSAK